MFVMYEEKHVLNELRNSIGEIHSKYYHKKMEAGEGAKNQNEYK